MEQMVEVYRIPVTEDMKEQIVLWMFRRNVTQAELGEMAGMSSGYIWQLLNKSETTSRKSWERVASVIGYNAPTNAEPQEPAAAPADACEPEEAGSAAVGNAVAPEGVAKLDENGKVPSVEPKKPKGDFLEEFMLLMERHGFSSELKDAIMGAVFRKMMAAANK
jgi:transcriptional regulator with XRE-family HTH domain